VLAVAISIGIFVTDLYDLDLSYGLSTKSLVILATCATLAGSGGVAVHFARRRQSAIATVPGKRAVVPDHASVPAPSRLSTGAEFCAALQTMLANHSKATLVKLEIDDFSRLRNMHGSAATEALLSTVASRLRHLVPPDAAVAILSGDEFAVLMLCEDAAQATAEGTRLVLALSDTYFVNTHTLDVSVSAGAALLPAHARTPDTALRAARLALAQARSGVGQGWRLFDPRMGVAAEALQELRTELRGAINAGQIIPYYQPIVSLTANRIVGFEVLARWQHPRRGLLPPDQFIPIAEQHRLCADLSLALLRQVGMDAGAWPEDWSFAFNASPTQLRDLLHFVSNPGPVRAQMIDPRRIELEVTEVVLIEDMPLAREVVQAMHRSGAKVVLDDFGTGYANFLQLRELPFDRVKIDRTFVKDMMVSQRTDACVRAMLALARSLDATVIAEGVETAAAANHLREMGCDFVQGFHYAPPVPASAVPTLRGAA
jgi:diguanylate cyclase (GGDEF)-like protein